MDTGDLYVFHVKAWMSKTKDDRQLFRDVPATVRGKSALKSTLICQVFFLSFLIRRKVKHAVCERSHPVCPIKDS